MASKEEKRRIVEGYATSGMTGREYCAKHGIAVSTLDYWRSKRKSKLVRVAIKGVIGEQPSGLGFTLTLGNGRRPHLRSRREASGRAAYIRGGRNFPQLCRAWSE